MAPSKRAAPRAGATAATPSEESQRTASEAGLASSRQSKRRKQDGSVNGGRPVADPLRAFIEMVGEAQVVNRGSLQTSRTLQSKAVMLRLMDCEGW
ncbi:hypothetical protein PG996_008159 [Apiospora saccharicola]|uniref:Uncharacterized protein n=1 Tax=Apiospora saccharicola TaxID=335842 RepID=A0ABR1UX44_9PEZI